MKEQPSNEQFENLIADELYKFNYQRNIFIEAESSNIGRCRVPNHLFKKMQIAPRIEILRSEKDRIEELVKTYSVFSKKELINSILRITKRLGPQRTKLAIQSVEVENWGNVCKALLDYYDKCYEYELKERNNVKKLNLTEVNENQIISIMIKNGLLN